MQEQQQTGTSNIVSNLPTILGLIVMFIITALYFITPQWTPGAEIRNAVTLSLPWPIAIVSAILIRNNIRVLLNRGSGWFYSLVIIVAAVVIVLLYLGSGLNVGEATMTGLYNNISIVGMMAVTSAISISAFSPMLRIYRAKTWTMALLITLSIIAFMTYTPIGEMIWPPIPQFGDWIQTYISGASDSAFWCSTYIAAVALIVRMTLLREKLKPQ